MSRSVDQEGKETPAPSVCILLSSCNFKKRWQSLFFEWHKHPLWYFNLVSFHNRHRLKQHRCSWSIDVATSCAAWCCVLSLLPNGLREHLVLRKHTYVDGTKGHKCRNYIDMKDYATKPSIFLFLSYIICLRAHIKPFKLLWVSPSCRLVGLENKKKNTLWRDGGSVQTPAYDGWGMRRCWIFSLCFV